MKDIFRKMGEDWPCPYVLRQQKILDKCSGGLLKARTLANLDCQGKGPAVRIKIGRKVAYPVSSLVEFLEKKSKFIMEGGKK